MGHERIGILPKSKTWRKVVSKISECPSDPNAVGQVANQVLINVKDKFINIEQDKGIIAAFKFLVLLSYSSKSSDPATTLQAEGVSINNLGSPLQIAKAASDWIEQNKQSSEYATVARGAVIDAMVLWQKQHDNKQGSLFEKETKDMWREAANGGGFCELSRLFFSKFTERYLKYFLEREASATLNTISDRNTFNANLEKHVQDISQHAFETSKITQSFAAGWFNKNVKNGIPSDSQVEGFLSIAFGKMKSELSREAMKE